MRGTILMFDYRTGSGEISGDDGYRYSFSVSEWKPEAPPKSGQGIDFEAVDNEARAIYALTEQNAPQRKRFIAALFALFLGALGIHKFYLGHNRAGLTMLLTSVFGIILLYIPTFIMAIIAFIEAIIYFMTSDEDFEERYVAGGKDWF